MSATAVTADAPPAPASARALPPERLSGPDAAWWQMERPDNQMVITGVLTFAEPLEWERVRAAVVERLVCHDRFRQRVDESAGPARWVEDERFDLDRHLLRVDAPEPGGREALQSLVGDLMSAPLDPRRPLWQLVLVDGYAGGSAIVARIHHCLADGVALVHLLLSLDDAPDNDASDAPRAAWTPAALRLPPPPASFAGRAARGVATGVAYLASAVGLLAMRSDPRSPFRGALGAQKVAAWSEPMPLDELKAVGRARGATLHDVVASTVAGAMRRYAEKHGRIPGRGVRAVVPVNLRAPEELGTLGNRFGLVFLSLPVPVADAGERLRRVKRSMDRLKRSPQALVIYLLLWVLGRLPRWVERIVVAILGKNATLVMTDVPGPREPVWFCGRKVRELMAWVPQSGRVALGVSILSYDGRVQVGVAADAGVVPDPDALVAEFGAALKELASGS